MNHISRLCLLASALAFLPGCEAPVDQPAPDAAHQTEQQRRGLMKSKSRLSSVQSQIDI